MENLENLEKIVVETRNHKRNQNGGIDCELKDASLGWLPFTAQPESLDPFVQTVWQAVKDRADVAPFEPPSNWKASAHTNVRKARDELLNAITDPDETQTGKLAWNAKLISSVVVLLGLDKTKALFGVTELPQKAEIALGQIVSSMTFLAEAQGVTVEQFAFGVVGKFFGFSAFVWLADEKTLKAWQAIDRLPDTAEGYAMLDDLEAQLSVEAQALVAQVKGLAAE